MKKGLLLCFVLVVLLFLSCATTGNNTKNTDQKQQNATVKLLEKQSNRSVYKVTGNKQNGSSINAYLIVPNKFKLKHLLVHPVKIGKEQAYEKSDLQVQDYALGKGHYHGLDVDNQANAISLLLALPETNMKDGHRHLSLDTTALLGNDEYAHLDQQVVAIIDEALTFLKEELSIVLPAKVDMSGYSGEAEFIVRFALLHPQRLNAVCAGGMSWSPAIALSSFLGSNLDYPLGVKDITKYSDDFNLEAWKEIKFFLDMGMLDDRGCYNKNDLAKLSWTQNLNYQSIWIEFCYAYTNLTSNAQLVSYCNLGHTYIEGDYAAFLLSNDGDSFVRTTPSQMAIVRSSEGTELVHNTVSKASISDSTSSTTIKAASASGLYLMTDWDTSHIHENGERVNNKGDIRYLVYFDGETVRDFDVVLENKDMGTVQNNNDGSFTVIPGFAGKTMSGRIIVTYKGNKFVLNWTSTGRIK